jgi:hypothetical protein
VLCLGLSDLWTHANRPYLSSFDVTTLVAHPRAYSIVTGSPGLPSFSWLCSRIPQTNHSAFRRPESSITAIGNLRPVRRSTVCARAFPVSGLALWNSLFADNTSIIVFGFFVDILKMIYSLNRIQAWFKNSTLSTVD